MHLKMLIIEPMLTLRWLVSFEHNPFLSLHEDLLLSTPYVI
jgi:hypothetical protein